MRVRAADGMQFALCVVRQRVHVSGRAENGRARGAGRGFAVEFGGWTSGDYRRRAYAAGAGSGAADAASFGRRVQGSAGDIGRAAIGAGSGWRDQDCGCEVSRFWGGRHVLHGESGGAGGAG